MTNIRNILCLLILPAVIAKVVIDDDGTERNTNVIEVSNDLKASSVQPENTTVSSSPANKYKLYYFDFRGRGELVRLLLHYVGEPFEDFRVPRADWIPVYKKKTPYGHIPVLEVKETGQSLAESYAICRYIARKHGRLILNTVKDSNRLSNG
ncbi:glutathione S-transferase 1 [Ditylenchus destructor]|uniref:glutathione transferase n=1 Tax=Ditylenchus destructor TaxID=166010 RepID=A0AAD4NCL5_9BILA|nr:glutathione S-transferase 1 [Ditylenchus destructor]